MNSKKYAFPFKIVDDLHSLCSQYQSDLDRLQPLVSQLIFSSTNHLLQAIFAKDDDLTNVTESDEDYIYKTLLHRLRSVYWNRLIELYELGDKLVYSEYSELKNTFSLDEHEVFDNFTVENINRLFEKYSIQI